MRRIVAVAVPLFTAFVLAGCKPSNDTTEPQAGGSEQTPSAGTPVTGGSDWAQWRGPKGDGFSPDAIANKSWGSKPPTLVWKIDMSDGGNAGPSVADGKVFIVDHQGDQDIVRALNISNGKDVWKYAYAEAGGNDNGFCRSTPVISEGKVYTLSRAGLLNCLDASNGNLVWKRDIAQELGGQKPQWGYSMSPYIDGDKVIVVPGSANGTVAALNKANGQTIWQGGGNDGAGYATPVKATIGGTVQYVIFAKSGVTGVDAQGGRQLWYYPWNTKYDVNAATPLVFGNSVFITSSYDKGCTLINVGSGGARAVWENGEMKAHFSSPVYYNGHIYGTTDNSNGGGDLVCLDAASGRALWRQSGFEKGGVAAADGTIFAMNGGGGDVAMVKLDPSSYQELGKFTPLGGKSWTAPIIAHGRLIVRNEQALACYSLE